MGMSLRRRAAALDVLVLAVPASTTPVIPSAAMSRYGSMTMGLYIPGSAPASNAEAHVPAQYSVLRRGCGALALAEYTVLSYRQRLSLNHDAFVAVLLPG